MEVMEHSFMKAVNFFVMHLLIMYTCAYYAYESGIGLMLCQYLWSVGIKIPPVIQLTGLPIYRL